MIGSPEASIKMMRPAWAHTAMGRWNVLIQQAQVEAYDTLVSAIYGSIDSEQPWLDPLEKLRVMLGANSTSIRISQKGAKPRQFIYATGPMVSHEGLENAQRFNPRELLPIELGIGEARTLDWGQIASSVPFDEMLRQHDIAYLSVVCIDMIDGAQCTLNCCRGKGAEPFTPIDLQLVAAAGRHFREAMRIRRELTRAKILSQFQTEALDSLGIAAFLVSKSGGHSVLNKTARFAIDNAIGLRQFGSSLHALNEDEDPVFQAAIRAALQAADGSGARAMLFESGDEGERLHVIVRPRIHQSLLHDKTEVSALVFLRVHEVVGRDDIKLLQQLFSFTPTEAQLAVGLAKGLCLKEIEASLNIRHNTARAHLRSMFVKTDVSRQSQLVSLLTNSLVPLGRNLHSLQ